MTHMGLLRVTTRGTSNRISTGWIDDAMMSYGAGVTNDADERMLSNPNP